MGLLTFFQRLREPSSERLTSSTRVPRSGRVRLASVQPSVYTTPPGTWERGGRSGQQCDSRPLPCPLQAHGRTVPVRMSSHCCQTKHLPQQANICMHPPPPLQPTGHCGFSVPASQTSTLKGKWHLVSGVDSSVRTQRSREVPRPQPAEWRCGWGGRAPTETFSALICVHRRLRRWPRRCHQVSMQGTEQGAKWRG